MAIELKARGIPFEREVLLTIYYKGQPLQCPYKADFIVYGTIVLKAKAVVELVGKHRSQTINYLKAIRRHRSLLINFGESSLKFERLVWGTQALDSLPPE